MKYTDLHNHLYGSIHYSDLYEIARNNQSPRWNIFTELYESLYNKKFNVQTFFEDYDTPEKFKNLYLFNFKAPFLEFQNKFNLLIALTKFDIVEIQEISKRIFLNHIKQNVDYAEYRITLSPIAVEKDYHDKILAACKGLQNAEIEIGYIANSRLIISFHRGGNYIEQYNWVKNLMKLNPIINKYLVGIDFSNVEENHPPKLKKDFFKKVLEDNQTNPQSSLCILYHVGESFNDKTPLSAIRWVYESAKMGVHRLGHCIALGMDFENYLNRLKAEKISERIDQLNFELENYEELKFVNACEDIESLYKEKLKMDKKELDSEIEIFFDEKKIIQLRNFQNFIMQKISKMNCIIEVCPTSNLLIGQLENLKNHPIKRFIEHGIKTTISTDDPGIFDTTIEREYQLLKETGIEDNTLDKIRIESYQYKSEILSGRTYL